MYQVEIGKDGLFYAVFKHSDDAWNFFERGFGVRIACFGAYENAVQLSETLGL